VLNESLLALKDLPAGSYSLSIDVHQDNCVKRVYVYAENQENERDVHMVGFAEFSRRGHNAKWFPDEEKPAGALKNDGT